MDNVSKQADIAEWEKPSSDTVRKADFALKLFKKDYPAEEIAEITGFSLKSVLRIKELLDKSESSELNE